MTIVVIGVELVASTGRAGRATDITTVSASPTSYDAKPHTVVPAYPSLFLHPGEDGPHRVPEFSRPDGTPIAIRRIVQVSTSPYALARIDLDIGDGEIVVRLAHDERPVATFVVDPMYRPRTRKVEVRPTGTLRIDSDAVEFAVYGRGIEQVVANDGTLRLELGTQQRVIALYGNGVAEEIYDDIPREAPPDEPADRRLVPPLRLKAMDLSALPATLLLLLVLAAIGVIAARTD
jgi:hypothetical protein